MPRYILAMFFILPGCVSSALNISIVESRYINPGHKMDTVWYQVCAASGHNPSIVPFALLESIGNFSTTDVLIISSGLSNLSDTKIATIVQFLQSKRPVYLQSEYKDTFSTNRAFEKIISQLGGKFTWETMFSGMLSMEVLGSFSNIPDSSPVLNKYWYSVSGKGDCNTIGFLKYSNAYHGFWHVPANKSYASIISCSDQDWIVNQSNISLMKNILYHLINADSMANEIRILPPDSILCNGESITLKAGLVDSLRWSDGSNADTLKISTAGKYWVKTYVKGCSHSDTINIGVSVSNPGINLGNDTTVCEGEVLVLRGIKDGNNIWSTGSKDDSIIVSQEGNYSVKTGSGKCLAGDSIFISVIKPAQGLFDKDTVICEGQVIKLQSDTADSYQWSDGSTSSSLNVFASGKYWLRSVKGPCITTDTIDILVKKFPRLNFGKDTILCKGKSIKLSAGDATIHHWSTGDSSATLEITTAGLYWIVAGDKPCMITDSILVSELPCNARLDMPNVFSPNGDQFNELFLPISYEEIRQAELKIYNRWGNLLFSSSNLLKNPWDGTYNGALCPAATYFWQLEYQTLMGETLSKTGTVLLIR